MIFYPEVVEAEFLSRPNRFIAEVMTGEGKVAAHVKNTGRCEELLVPGAGVFLAVSGKKGRKTKYDLVCVEKRRNGKTPLLVNVDSQIPNDVAAEWLPESGLCRGGAVIRREVRYRNSRFDFFIEDGARRIFLEVKGVTLEKNGIAMFPDAPTERGVKHIRELADCISEGLEAYVLFVIQMDDVLEFRPNDAMHSAFGDALRRAEKYGVRLLAVSCRVGADFIGIARQVPVKLY